MILRRSGWSQERGFFEEKYEIDTARTDHEIRWSNGKVCKQLYPFTTTERDWNNDGDVYELFGAVFEGLYGGREHYTPQNLLRLILDGDAEIPGIKEVR